RPSVRWWPPPQRTASPACRRRRRDCTALQYRARDLDCQPASLTMPAVFKLPFSASLLATCLLAAGPVSTASAQSFSPLEERMSAAQFRTAGLDKLSPEELAALNAWLQQNLDMPQAVAPMPYGSGRGAPGGDGGTVRSRLIGEFRGWSGKTTFQLENGQVWQ